MVTKESKKGQSIGKFLKQMYKNHSYEEAEEIKLIMMMPLITTYDSNLLAACHKVQYLSFSSNAIHKMTDLPQLRHLRILSLARNNIRKIKGLGEVADSLEELWLSYNKIDTLAGLQICKKLKVLYMSNNQLAVWSDIDSLKHLPKLTTVLFKNNPIYYKDNLARIKALDMNPFLEILKRVPSLLQIDGIICTQKHRAQLPNPEDEMQQKDK